MGRLRAAARKAAEARAELWHLQEAEDCLEHNNRPAARFHLRFLDGVAPDGPLQVRKERLANRLKP